MSKKEETFQKNCSYGERIYYKDMALRDFNEKKREKMRLKLLEEEKLNETHQPKISLNSIMLNNRVNK